MLKFTFSTIFLLVIVQLYGQGPNAAVFADQPKDFRPSILKLSYDIVPMVEGVFFGNRSGQHLQAAIDFHQYYLVAEYGLQKSERGETFQYESSGNYFRVGPEVNLLKNSEKNSLTFGLRYAQASFEDELLFQYTDDILIREANHGLSARWLEFTAGLNVNVWKGLYMGYVVRYKFLRRIKNDGTLVPYDVPGFGLEENKTSAGFSYFIGWAIPLREKPEPLPVQPGR